MSEPPTDQNLELDPQYRNKAIEALAALGLADAKADQVLQLTEASFLEHRNWQRWLEDALLEFAKLQELADEAGKMAVAMAESLEDHEAAKCCVPSVSERPVSDLVERFKSSPVLAKARGSLDVEVLFASPLKEPVVEFLELERKCFNWYPGAQTKEYFSNLADAIMQQLGDVDSASKQEPRSSGSSSGDDAAHTAGTAGCQDGHKRKAAEHADAPCIKRTATGDIGQTDNGEAPGSSELTHSIDTGGRTVPCGNGVARGDAGQTDDAGPMDQGEPAAAGASGSAPDVTRLIQVLKEKTNQIRREVSKYPDEGIDVPPAIFRKQSSTELNYDLSSHGIALVCADVRPAPTAAACDLINLD